MEKFGIVYIWRDRKHNKYYVGSHWGTEDDGYICSNPNMRNNRKNRPQDFKRRIISKFYTNRKDLLKEEQRYLDMIQPYELGKKYYNINPFVYFCCWWMNEETKAQVSSKIAKRTKEGMAKPEVRQKYLTSLESRGKCRQDDPNVRAKKSASMKATMAKKFPFKDRHQPMQFGSEEYCDHMRIKAAERWKDPSYKDRVRANISKALIRKPKPNMFWWTNGKINTRSKESPGDKWVRGRFRTQ